VLPPFFMYHSLHHDRVKVLNYSIRTNTILVISTWQSPYWLVYNIKDSSDGGGKASPILEKLEIYGDGPPDSVVQFPHRSVPYFASMLTEAFSKRGGALHGLRINREILILRKPPIEVLLNASVKYS